VSRAWLTNHRPSVLWHCWLSHETHKIVPEMTHNVLSGTVNPTVPVYLPSCLIYCIWFVESDGDDRNWRHSLCCAVTLSCRFRLMSKYLVEFNQLAIEAARGSHDMINRVMTKDNIGLAALLETQPAIWENGTYAGCCCFLNVDKLAAWLSGNMLVSISGVMLHWARLVPGG